MKIIRFTADSGVEYGILSGGAIQAIEGEPFHSITPTDRHYQLSEVNLLSPCTPTKIVALGLNYHNHAKELNAPLPNAPLIFLKPSTAVIGTEANIIYPCPSASCQNINQERIEELRQKYNLQNKKVLLTVGRLVERKGHDKVIEALPNILRQVPSVVYLIVGNGENYKKLKQLVEKNSLQDRVLFFTDVLDSELPYFYCLADVFIMPSRRLDDGDIEGFGIVYLEANCYAKPAIAGRSGGAVEAVEHNVTGLLVDPMSVNEIAQAVISLFRNEKRAQELGERGRNRVNLRFHWAKQAEKLRKLLI